MSKPTKYVTLLLLGLCAIGIASTKPSRSAHPDLYRLKHKGQADEHTNLNSEVIISLEETTVHESKKL
jgi:hypothetical protein